MRNVITILICMFSLGGIIAQNEDGPGRSVPKVTPQIKALYEQQRELKAAGDVSGLSANRQALLAAWQDLDPTIAAEFKPNQVKETEQFAPETVLKNVNMPINNNPIWGGDLELDNDFMDGVDIDIALDGTIYVVAYENRLRYGLDTDYIRRYKSIDNGVSFTYESTTTVGSSDVTKIKLTIMDKGATKYLFVTYSSVSGALVNLRYDLAGGQGSFAAETIAENVKEFDIDVDYEFVSASQLYAVYTKTDNMLYSARSAANSTGFDWGDEHNFGFFAKECALTYGKGNTYLSFIGFNSGNLYFASNTGYNDPAGWDTLLQLTDGAVRESKEISMSAERKNFGEYRALVLACQRTAGSTDGFKGAVNIVQEGIAFPEDIVAPNIRLWDSWSRKEDGNTIIKTSFENINATSCRVKNYEDTVWEDSELISDIPITLQRGSTAVAEDADGNAIAVYIGENRTGLYFDTDKPLAVDENTLNGFVFYPNPSSNTVTLKAESTINNVAIFNLLGQQVLNQTLDAISSEINVSNLSIGTYIMKVTIGSETGSYKIIKN